MSSRIGRVKENSGQGLSNTYWDNQFTDNNINKLLN